MDVRPSKDRWSESAQCGIDPVVPNLSQICRLLAHTCALLRVKLKKADSLPIGSGSGNALEIYGEGGIRTPGTVASTTL